MYTFLFIFVIVFGGAVIENLDRYAGAGMRRRLGWSPAGNDQGFIAGRDAQQRSIWMTVVFGVWIALSIVFSAVNFETVLRGVLVIPALVAGSYAGPWLGKVWGRRDAFFKAVDDFQQNPESIFSGIAAWWNRLVAPTIVPAERVIITPAPKPDSPQASQAGTGPVEAPKPDDHKGDYETFVQ